MTIAPQLTKPSSGPSFAFGRRDGSRDRCRFGKVQADGERIPADCSAAREASTAHPVRMSASATLAPSAVSCSAVARPTPPAAPVTRMRRRS